MKKTLFLPILLIFILLASSIACGIDLSGNPSGKENNKELEALQLQVTVQALQLTQAASVQNQPAAAQQPIQQPPQQAQQQQPASDPNPPAASGPTPTVDNGIPCNSSKFVSETIETGTSGIIGKENQPNFSSSSQIASHSSQRILSPLNRTRKSVPPEGRACA